MTVRVTKSAIKAYMVDLMKTKRDCAFPTLAGGRVFKDHFVVLQAEDLPALLLFAMEETSDQLDNTQDRRHLKIQIEVQVVGEDADTQLDILSDQVYDLFRNDEYLGGSKDGLVEWCRYTGGHLFYDERRHVNGAVWVMDYEVRYIAQTAPDIELSGIAPFGLADVTYALEATPADTELTEDLIVIPQI